MGESILVLVFREMGYRILEIFHVYLVSLNDSLEDLEWFEKRKKRYSIRSLVGNNPLRKVCVCEKWSVCYNTTRRSILVRRVSNRFRHDSCKKEKKRRGGGGGGCWKKR